MRWGADRVRIMPKGYVVAEVEITDPMLFERYRALVPATIERYGGRYLVRGGDALRLEGDRPLHRFVVLEFDSPQQASGWYHSEEYAAAKALRHRSATTHVFLVNGVDAK